MNCDICDGSGSLTQLELEKQCCYQPSQYGSCCGNAIAVQVQVQYPCPNCNDNSKPNEQENE